MAETTVDLISPTQIIIDDSQVSVGPGGGYVLDMTAGADGALLAANNLDDLDDAATALTNLGGTATGVALFTAAAASNARSTLGITNIVSQVVYIPDITGAGGDLVQVVAPVTGTISGADYVCNATTAVGASTATLAIDTAPVTNGVMSVDGVDGTVGPCTPTADNAVVFRTSVVSITIGGANTTAGDGSVIIYYTPA